MSHIAEREKIKLALNYMRAHEEALEKTLEHYEEEADPGVLNTWFKYTPPEALATTVEQANLTPDMTSDDIIRLALRLGEQLLKLYRECSKVQWLKT